MVGAGTAAAQTTDEALTSPRVAHALVVSREGDRLMVCADVEFVNLLGHPHSSCRTATDSPLRYVALAGREIQVVWARFNPLLENVSGTITSSPDPAAAALASIADALRGLGASLSGGQREFRAADAQPFFDKVKAYEQTVVRPIIEPSDVATWRTLAFGRSGILAARTAIKQASDKLSTHFDEVEKALTEIDTAAQGQPDLQAIAVSLRIANVNVLAQKRRLARAIQALDETLAGFATRTWLGEALVINSITVSAENEATDTLTVRAVSLSLKDGDLLQALGDPSKIDMRVRAHRLFVAESAVGIVYTSLRKAVYKAVEDGDHLVVKKGEDEPVDLSAVAAINLVCRCFSTPGLNPMLQIGVSSADDLPTILVGAGLRLRGKLPVSLSGGVVLAWLKDLDALSPGDTVANDLEIQADLKRHFTMKAYFGLQFKF
jgi:hypothetical protein